MFFLALATDYDGTLAHNGSVDLPTVEALKAVKKSGRKLILVTGRELPELQRVFPGFELFDLIVAENGALLFDPSKNKETPLAEPPPAAFVRRLQELGVTPMSVGRTIVATWEPHEATVLGAIRDLGLELHIIFNKGAVMVLPSTVNKASGLERALEQLCLSPHNVVGIGDAENDLAFISACGCGAAVENALPSVKKQADLIVADHGAGVVQLAKMLIESDLRELRERALRQQPLVGTYGDSRPVHLSPFETMLVTGSSSADKSSLVNALLEQMRELHYQYCVVDPEGDYSELADTVVVGDAKQEPRIPEALKLLAKPTVNVVINLLAIEPDERPRFLAQFWPEIAKLRSETGRPHWLVVDEVHHCLPADWDPAPVTLPQELPAVIAVTTSPQGVSHDFLELVSTVVGVGEGSMAAIESFCQAAGRPAPRAAADGPQQAYLLSRSGDLNTLAIVKPKISQQRQARKYAQGELGEDKSFYFHGPTGELNLRAQNLTMFIQLAAGIDDRTWVHHLRAAEYSRWFREAIKDERLAGEASLVEADTSLSPRESRRRIKEMIERRYGAPAQQK